MVIKKIYTYESVKKKRIIWITIKIDRNIYFFLIYIKNNNYAIILPRTDIYEKENNNNYYNRITSFFN